MDPGTEQLIGTCSGHELFEKVLLIGRDCLKKDCTCKEGTRIVMALDELLGEYSLIK